MFLLENSRECLAITGRTYLESFANTNTNEIRIVSHFFLVFFAIVFNSNVFSQPCHEPIFISHRGSSHVDATFVSSPLLDNIHDWELFPINFFECLDHKPINSFFLSPHSPLQVHQITISEN